MTGIKDNSGTLVGPPCRMINGGKIMEILQYGWSGGLMNMPIHKGFDLLGGTEIKLSLGIGTKKYRENMRCESHRWTVCRKPNLLV